MFFQAQQRYESAATGQITYPQQGAPQQPYPPQQSVALYPSLGSYMGLELTPAFVEQNMPVVAQVGQLFIIKKMKYK